MSGSEEADTSVYGMEPSVGVDKHGHVTLCGLLPTHEAAVRRILVFAHYDGNHVEEQRHLLRVREMKARLDVWRKADSDRIEKCKADL